MRSPRFSSVNLFEESVFSEPKKKRIAPSPYGTDSSVPSPTGRFTRKLNWNDSYIILHKGVAPVASPETQTFLEKSAHLSANTALFTSHHPVMSFVVPGREIRPRVIPPLRPGETYTPPKNILQSDSDSRTHTHRNAGTRSPSCPSSARNNHH